LEFFTNTLEDVSRHEKLITGINSYTGTNLVLLLSGHNLTVGSRDLNSGIQTGTVVGIGDRTSEGVLGTNRAVVRSLRAGGDTSLGPTEGSALVKVEEGEFLLESEPDFFVFLALEGLGGNSPGISRQRLSTGSVSIAHDQNVINTISPGAEGILENTARSQNDLRVITGGLAGGRPIKVPTGEVLNGSGPLHGESAGLGTAVTGGIDPDVFGQYLFSGVGEGVESVDDCGV
jgi:hypothetical protein